MKAYIIRHKLIFAGLLIYSGQLLYVSLKKLLPEKRASWIIDDHEISVARTQFIGPLNYVPFIGLYAAFQQDGFYNTFQLDGGSSVMIWMDSRDEYDWRELSPIHLKEGGYGLIEQTTGYILVEFSK